MAKLTVLALWLELLLRMLFSSARSMADDEKSRAEGTPGCTNAIVGDSKRCSQRTNSQSIAQSVLRRSRRLVAVVGVGLGERTGERYRDEDISRRRKTGSGGVVIQRGERDVGGGWGVGGRPVMEGAATMEHV